MHWNETFLLGKNRLLVTSTCLFNKTFDLMLELLLILNEPFILLEIYLYFLTFIYIFINKSMQPLFIRRIFVELQFKKGRYFI